MEVKILEQKENKVLQRKEVIAEVHEKTIPAKQQVRDKLSALLNTKPEEIAITKMESKFGSAKTIIYARVYSSADDLKKKEPKYVRERNFGKDQAKADAFAGRSEAEASPRKKADATQGPEAPPANFKK